MNPIFSEGGIEIYLGECSEVMRAIPEVDHVISDPPYAAQTHDGARSSKRGYQIDFMPTSADSLTTLFSQIRMRRWAILFNDYHHASAMEKNPPAGWRSVRIGIWNKINYTPQFTGDRPSQGWEAISMFHKAGERMKWNGGGKKSVYDFARDHGTEHPTQKPIKLLQQLILDFTDPGDLILDPFMGSGTTLVAAKQLGRRAIGIEIQKKYCELAIERLRQGSLNLYGGSSCDDQCSE